MGWLYAQVLDEVANFVGLGLATLEGGQTSVEMRAETTIDKHLRPKGRKPKSRLGKALVAKARSFLDTEVPQGACRRLQRRQAAWHRS